MSLLEFAAHPQICNQMLRMIGSLEKFYFVGTQEFLLDDLYQLRNLLEWPAFEIKPINTNPFPNYQEYKKVILGNTKLIGQLESLNKEDIKLYQDALTLRENRLKTSRLRNQ